MTENVIHHYRVTKCDPAFRDQWGAYTRDEWVTVTEIGRDIGGHVLTEQEFHDTVNKYLYAAEAFARESDVTELTLKRFFQGEDYADRWGHLQTGDQVSLGDAIEMMRAMLEGYDLLAILESEDFFVHAGYDMYMWIGSHVDCVKATAEAQRIGLFVEPGIVSPNLKPRPNL
jgi:hypothetical protein